MGYENQEQQKEYNKKYYTENKNKIKAKITKPEDCPFCGRYVNHSNMKKHKKSDLCKNNRDEYLELQNRNLTVELNNALCLLSMKLNED